jgi:hypothetical protein
MQIQNHDIAISGGAQNSHPVFIQLLKDLEFLPQSGREQRVERSIFRIQPDFDHRWTRTQTKRFSTAFGAKVEKRQSS